MPTPYELAQMVHTAQAAGATHVFIARDVLARDRFFPIPVYPGTNPHDVVRDDPADLVKCYALQNPALPIDQQLAERRPWHLGEDTPPYAGPEQWADTVTINDLAVARNELLWARQWKSAQTSTADDHIRHDRTLVSIRELALAAYEEGLLSRRAIRDATGLRFEDVAPIHHPYRPNRAGLAAAT